MAIILKEGNTKQIIANGILKAVDADSFIVADKDGEDTFTLDMLDGFVGKEIKFSVGTKDEKIDKK